MATIDLIPNGLPNLPEYANTAYACADCGQRLALDAETSFCEIRIFDGSKPWGERSTLIGRACLDCTDIRDAEALRLASESNGSFRGYVDSEVVAIHGVRQICDRRGSDLLIMSHVGATQRLESGDSMTSIRARDKSGREWYGRVRSLGYGTQYVALRPCKRAR